MKAFAMMAAAGMVVGVGAGGLAQQPVAPAGNPAPVMQPVEKPPFQPKQLSSEEKSRMQRDGATKRFEEFQARWTGSVNSPLTIEQPVRDIGRVTDDAPVKVMFNFRNTSDKTVKITGTKAGCGCTVPKLSKDTYAPGEEGSIEAAYNPQHRRGLEFKDIDVTVDTPGTPPLKIGFLVETLPRVVAEPVNVFMPDVRRGTDAKQVLAITGREPGFEVTGVTMADPNAPFVITRTGSTQMTDDSGDTLTRVEYEVALKPGQQIGRYSTRMAVATNDAKRPSVDVSLGAQVVGDVRVVPENVLAVGQSGMPFAKEARIDHRLAKPFNIVGVETQGLPRELGLVMDVQSAQISGAPGEVIGYTLKVAGTFPAGGGNLAGKILVRTDLPDQPVIEVPFQGVIPMVKQAPGTAGPLQPFQPAITPTPVAPAPGGTPGGK